MNPDVTILRCFHMQHFGKRVARALPPLVGITGRYTPMKVLVPVKRVIDYNVKVRVKADGT
ncbi:hypothetical protein, partial [Aliiroseovarius sp. PrR006]|uniref:hypothetical protein n=1 Tax=Aliiroseovarius sp. PrR006 TaxID=2706883 RepID=UPI00351A05E3